MSDRRLPRELPWSWLGALGACLLLAACSASVTRVAAPDGKPAWLIDCASTAPGLCAVAAQEQCPQGYGLLDSEVDRFLVRCRDAEVEVQPTAPATSSGLQSTLERDSTANRATREPSPTSYDSPAEPAPPRALDNRFVLRVGLGGGSLTIDESGPNSMPSANGWGVAIDAMAGYALTRSIAVGGSIAFQHASLIGIDFGHFYRAYEDEVLSTLTVAGGTIGIFGIGDTGFHADFTAGFALHTVEQSKIPSTFTTASPYARDARFAPGLGLSSHLAYGFRVGPQMRLNVGGRLMAASTTYDAYSQGLVSYAFVVDVLHY